MRTFVFKVYDGSIQGFRWVPVPPEQAVCAWSALDTTSTAAPSPTLSYFVPQVGSVTTPSEGAAAFRHFATCPHNDSSQLNVFSSRIKIVARDAGNNAIPGISAGDIFILFNGGTQAQGFAGQGADSVIANKAYNPYANCPDTKVITADAPTDVNGVTYITFAGATPGSPGVATRDPLRKWGHYDGILPVYMLGVKLRGQLTSTDATPYSLIIHNYDHQQGLSQTPNAGELVNSLDINPVQADVYAHFYDFWEDFDSSGAVDGFDLNAVK